MAEVGTGSKFNFATSGTAKLVPVKDTSLPAGSRQVYFDIGDLQNYVVSRVSTATATAINDHNEASNPHSQYSLISQIVNDLASTLADAPLSANQGRVLKSLVDTMQTELDSINLMLSNDVDVDSVVNKVAEVLAVFTAYPEGLDLYTELQNRYTKEEIDGNFVTNEILANAFNALIANGSLILNIKLWDTNCVPDPAVSIGNGNIMYLKPDGMYGLASNADLSTCSTELRMYTSLAPLRYGRVSWSGGLTPGADYYLGEDGSIVTPKPAGNVRYVGTAESSNIFIFNPSCDVTNSSNFVDTSSDQDVEGIKSFIISTLRDSGNTAIIDFISKTIAGFNSITGEAATLKLSSPSPGVYLGPDIWYDLGNQSFRSTFNYGGTNYFYESADLINARFKVLFGISGSSEPTPVNVIDGTSMCLRTRLLAYSVEYPLGWWFGDTAVSLNWEERFLANKFDKKIASWFENFKLFGYDTTDEEYREVEFDLAGFANSAFGTPLIITMPVVDGMTAILALIADSETSSTQLTWSIDAIKAYLANTLAVTKDATTAPSGALAWGETDIITLSGSGSLNITSITDITENPRLLIVSGYDAVKFDNTLIGIDNIRGGYVKGKVNVCQLVNLQDGVLVADWLCGSKYKLQIEEDMISLYNNVVGKLITNYSGTGVFPSTVNPQQAGRIGVLSLNTGSTATGRFYIGTNQDAFFLDSNTTYVAEFEFKTPSAVSDGTNTYQMKVGASSTQTALATDYGFYLKYDLQKVEASDPLTASNTWKAVFSKGSNYGTEKSFVDTGVAFEVDTWMKVTVIATAARQEIFIDGVSVAVNTNAAYMPLTDLYRCWGFGVLLIKSAGTTSRNYLSDKINIYAY